VTVICSNVECGQPVPDHERSCVVCGADAGFPNVRAASSPEEVAALTARFESAEASARNNGWESVFASFHEACRHTRAVICRSVSQVKQLVSSDNALYNNFYRQLEAGIRIPDDNQWDRNREAIESKVFPNYHRNIVFGVLSLTDTGNTAYGEASIKLRNAAIKQRSTVFEEPLFPFLRSRSIGVTEATPHGHRAPWNDRSRLCAAKIGSRLRAETNPSDYQSLILDPKNETESDCIEVHVFGPVHRRAIETVTCKRPSRREDRLILRSISKELALVGATLVVEEK
jgi:hypothetical protein